jgi:hypothetical protein
VPAATIISGAAAGETAVQPAALTAYGPLAGTNTWTGPQTFNGGIKLSQFGSTPQIGVAVDTSYLYVSGGTPGPDAGYVTIYGGSHATNPGDVQVKAGTSAGNVRIGGNSEYTSIDGQTGNWQFRTNSISGVSGLEISGAIASTASTPITWGGTNTYLAREGDIGGTNSLYWTVGTTNYHLRLK